MKKVTCNILFAFVILLTMQNAMATEMPVKEEAANQSHSKIQEKLMITPELGDTNFHVVGQSSSYLSGYSVGAMVKIPTSNERMHWIVGGQYFQAGLKIKEDVFFFSIDKAKVSLDYLSVPLKAEYSLSDPASTGVKYIATAGITPSYLLSAKYKDLLSSQSSEEGIRGELNGLDVLAGASLGAKYDTQIGAFEFTFEYQHGTMNVFKNQSSKNEGFIGKIGYNIVL